MKSIGKYQNREVIWMDGQELMLLKHIPNSNWISFVTSSLVKPDWNNFDQFVRSSTKNGIIEFKGHGKYGELLHDWFDETILVMETMEQYSEIEVMTTWHNDESFADVFWQCFYATCLPETTDFENIKIVCSDLDGVDRSKELNDYLVRFENGWLP